MSRLIDLSLTAGEEHAAMAAREAAFFAANPMPKVVIERDNWVPACGGTETPFKSRSGIRMLYCWNPRRGIHAYLNVDTDIVMSDDEARAALAL